MDDVTDDPIGESGDKADGWWTPTRKLVISTQTFELESDPLGYTVRDTFDPDAYHGTIFTAKPGVRMVKHSRSWITEPHVRTYETEPYLFNWQGPPGGDVTDWKNWSMFSYCCNDREVILPASSSGRYLLVVATRAEAYKEHAPSLAYLRQSPLPDAPAQVAGIVRCGRTRQPVAGKTLSIDVLPAEHVTTRADGSFEFTEPSTIGRHQIFVETNTRTIAFDVIFAPDNGRVELLLERCP